MKFYGKPAVILTIAMLACSHCRAQTLQEFLNEEYARLAALADQSPSDTAVLNQAELLGEIVHVIEEPGASRFIDISAQGKRRLGDTESAKQNWRDMLDIEENSFWKMYACLWLAELTENQPLALEYARTGLQTARNSQDTIDWDVYVELAERAADIEERRGNWTAALATRYDLLLPHAGGSISSAGAAQLLLNSAYTLERHEQWTLARDCYARSFDADSTLRTTSPIAPVLLLHHAKATALGTGARAPSVQSLMAIWNSPDSIANPNAAYVAIYLLRALQTDGTSALVRQLVDEVLGRFPAWAASWDRAEYALTDTKEFALILLNNIENSGGVDLLHAQLASVRDLLDQYGLPVGLTRHE